MRIYFTHSSDGTPQGSYEDCIKGAGHETVRGNAESLLGAEALFICICGKENRRVKEDLNLALDRGIPVAFVIGESGICDAGLDIQLAIAARISGANIKEDVEAWLKMVEKSSALKKKKKSVKTAVIAAVTVLAVAACAVVAVIFFGPGKDSEQTSAVTIEELIGISEEELAASDRIDLSGKNLTDVSFLEGCVGCRELDISNNAITDISVLSGLKNLVVLKAGKNKIADISVLSDLAELEELDVSGNEVSDINVLLTLKKLKKADISDNPIHDRTAIGFLNGVVVIE